MMRIMCEQYNNLEFNQSACPMSAAAPCKPVCHAPLGINGKHCYDEATFDPAEAWHPLREPGVRFLHGAIG